jgi:hypothetical protein
VDMVGSGPSYARVCGCLCTMCGACNREVGMCAIRQPCAK